MVERASKIVLFVINLSLVCSFLCEFIISLIHLFTHSCLIRMHKQLRVLTIGDTYLLPSIVVA